MFARVGYCAACFNDYALILTLIISPLLALMKDQVDSLRKGGVLAANLGSTLNIDKSQQVKGTSSVQAQLFAADLLMTPRICAGGNAQDPLCCSRVSLLIHGKNMTTHIRSQVEQ